MPLVRRFVRIFARSFARSFVVPLLALAVPVAHAAKPLAACDDLAGWPPFAYADTDDAHTVKGATVELLRDVLARAGYALSVELLPWKRCLAEVEAGRMALVLNASLNDERRRNYLHSQPLYEINGALYYLKERFPEPPVFKSPAQLEGYKICGLLGYNYEMYALPPGSLDASPFDESARLRMMRHGRCDFALSDIEVMQGFVALGRLNLSGFAHVLMPGGRPKPFHTLVSRRIPEAENLVRQIDEGLAQARSSGRYQQIFRRYGL